MSEYNDDKIFIPSEQPTKPGISPVPWDEKERATASPVVCLDMQTVHKRVASILIPWPAVAMETIRYWYEGKKLPRQLGQQNSCSVFLELLDEVVVSWKDCPLSGKTQIHGALEGMKKFVIHHMNPRWRRWWPL